MKKYRFRDYLFAIITIVVGGQVLFNVSFSMLGIPYAIENNMLPEAFLVMAGYSVAGALVWAMLRYTVDRRLYKDTIIAGFLTLPTMAIMLALGITFYESAKWLPISIGLALSIIAFAFLYIKKAPWVYFVTVLYVDILALWIVLFDIQI